jgi:recombination protein RecA
MISKEDKKKNLAKIQAAMKVIEQDHGKGSIMRANDTPMMDIEVIPTGSIALNDALGVGGWPKGRIIEIYGPESSGKTTLCLHAIAESQAAGGYCAFIDAEHALDLKYGQALGVNKEDLYLSQPDHGEQALEILDTLINSDGVDLIVVDSVAALVPKAELEGDMGDAQMALQARLMSQALRKITGAVKRTNTTVIFTNQLRMKIGVVFGNPTTTSGGNALKFYASVRCDIVRGGQVKKGEDVIGSATTVKVIKNKVAPPFTKADIPIRFGIGISKVDEMIDFGVKHGVINKSGSWYSYNDERIGQGADNVAAYMKENPSTVATMKEEVEEILEKSKQEVKDLKADTAVKNIPTRAESKISESQEAEGIDFGDAIEEKGKKKK